MPTFNEIFTEVLNAKSSEQDKLRRSYLRSLSSYTGRDTILYGTAFTAPAGLGLPPPLLSIVPGDVQGFMSAVHGLKGKQLDLVLHSPGGSLEAADQIVQYLRAKYDHIRAIIPQNAMSAATMIACACDELVMAKHSAIGPIDPQMSFPTPSGMCTSPAQAILDEFEQAKQEVKKDQSCAILWAPKVQAYPHGFLKNCSTVLALSRGKVAEWLDKYMFRDLPAKKRPGKRIANWLGNAKIHKTHGRPITIECAKNQGLKVIALEDDDKLQDKVLSVFHALTVTFMVTNCVKIIENQEGRGTYINVQIQQPMPFMFPPGGPPAPMPPRPMSPPPAGPPPAGPQPAGPQPAGPPPAGPPSAGPAPAGPAPAAPQPAGPPPARKPNRTTRD